MTHGGPVEDRQVRESHDKSWHGLPFWHGQLGRGQAWPAPELVASEPQEARPGFSSCSADEYEDFPEVLAAKAKLVAGLLRRSRYTVAYTGAGISTAAGIKDYASRASTSKVNHLVTNDSLEEGLHAQPTWSHRFFTELWRQELLHHWVQQNHDGLPQKAGYPQEALNEIHGSWFDPSNPVVHFRAELRPENFAWMLDAELRCDLVLAVGTSLCDTPSTADRMVVSPMERTKRARPSSSSGADGAAVVVGLQRTRLDQDVQLRVFGEADAFFQLVAKEMSLSIKAELTVEKMSEEAAPYSVGQVVHITAGPSAGRALRIAKQVEGNHFQLDGGHLLGAWWLNCPHHPCPFPLSTTPLPRCMRYQRVVDAARLIEVPCSGAPESFLSGRWRGDAVRLQGAKDHPTATAERTQDLCWALSFQKESIEGVGFTTWPAAAVLCNVGGRAWHKLSGRYEGGRFQLELGWETSVASRRSDEPLGADQGERRMLRCQVAGRIWWDDRRGRFVLAGLWHDEGLSGALLMSQELDSDAGRWEGTVDNVHEEWLLAVDLKQRPQIFGVVIGEGGSDEWNLIRGFCDQHGKVALRKDFADGSFLESPWHLESRDLPQSCDELVAANSRMCQVRPWQRIADITELLGSYCQSRGSSVQLIEDDGQVKLQTQKEILQTPAFLESGRIRLHKQCGHLKENKQIVWSNGSIWTREVTVDSIAEKKLRS
ncbi:unnamed protein product [Cladocopium goreaui]|uniref:NAD-dependent protein deacetylase Sirt7 (Regulatory protein SIR2 homolog 7) (SIR2-like protein 7) n=1 Tax=Cladocopium goreaui TaxID=2562237 RepID=A0A9P1DTS3_9DINO|nr:unnamed protein product [Cladocopium goreaui]